MTAVTPAAVGGSPTGKCGLLPQHFHHRVNAVVVLLANIVTIFYPRDWLIDWAGFSVSTNTV